MITAALDLARAGWPVFPCRADKKPACPHGFLDATSDPEAVQSLFSAHPGPLIGVPTGEVSGLAALDLDARHGATPWWNANRHMLPETRTHRTRSGGLHLVYRQSPELRCSVGLIAPGVDIRADGGYIIWWPATGLPVLMDRAPAQWPSWLREILSPPPIARQSPATPTLSGATGSPVRIIAAALARVRNAAEGQRHYNLRNAALTLGGLLDTAGMGEAEARQMLVQAAKDAGARDLRNAENTAVWGLQTGRAKPLNLGGRA